jgi:hypothetical protein
MVRDFNRELLTDLYTVLHVYDMVRDVNREPLSDFYTLVH